jgi:phage gpG-like protein
MATPIKAVTTPRGLKLGNVPGKVISVDWDPSPAILAAGYFDFGISLRSYREPLKRSVQKVVAPSIKHNFEVGGRPAWLPLAEYTQEARAREGYGSARPILVRTGKLKRVAGQLNIWTIESDKAFVSQLPGADYGIVHQGGGGAGAFKGMAGDLISGEVPARPFLLIQDDDVDRIETVFLDWARERLVLAGFKPGI